MIAIRMLVLGLLLLPLPLVAQQTAARAPGGSGMPEALRGPWFSGASCEAPDAMLFLTARGALRVTDAAAPVLRRFVTVATVPGGWTLGTAGGAEAPRFAVRSPGPDRLDLLEPAAKTRDDRLPGQGAVQSQWRRCQTLPPAMAARYAEALDSLVVLEHLEMACGAGAPVAECLASLVARLDITGDGGLSVAELARFGRGAAQLAALQAGTPVPAATFDAVLAAARALVDGHDYDGDGRLSQAELAQDRAALGATPAAGGPLPTLPPVPGLEMLRGATPAR